ARNGVDARIEFVECNLLDALLHESRITLRFDSGQATHPSHPLRVSHPPPSPAIVSNPPYTARSDPATLAREVREHEPESALFAGETGMEMYAPLIAQAAMLLKPGGILVLELGYNSAEHVSRLLNVPEWCDAAITNDLAGIKRVA